MSTPRILLVDDEPGLLDTLAANLELEGLAVATAGSGARALELMKTQPFDLVLSDVRMPGMSGVELCRTIHKLHPELPVILMTAFAMESLLEQAIREGAFAILPKPFDVDQVLKLLLQAVRHPTVLLIDTEQQEAQLAVEALNAIGLRARAVADEQAALRAIREEAIDVCVVDLVMAQAGNPSLIKQLRQACPELSFIAIAGHDVSELMRKMAAEGPVSWIGRPVDPAVLAHRISAVRGRRVARK